MNDPVLIDLPTTVETERLVMRPPQPGDGPALHAAITESLAELRRFLAWLPWVAAEQTIESSEIYCRNAQSNFLSRKDLPFLFEKATRRLVGATGLHSTVWATPKTEIGYWGRTSAGGNGFISEAVSALTAYAFAHLRAVRVEIITDEENAGSRRVAERCRFGHSSQRAPRPGRYPQKYLRLFASRHGTLTPPRRLHTFLANLNVFVACVHRMGSRSFHDLELACLKGREAQALLPASPIGGRWKTTECRLHE